MMKHMGFRRLLALALTLALCLSLAPLTAYAGGSEDMPLEVTVFDNNRSGEWGGGATDGYLELDESGVIRFDISAAASLSEPGELKGAWLVDAATRAARYDLLSASYGGENQSAVESFEDENGTPIHMLNLYVTGLTISGAAVGDYRLKVQVGSEVLYSEAYSDAYFSTDGLVHVVAHGTLSSGPRITSGSPTPAKLGKPYSAKLEATPEHGGAITWSIAEGSMPPGLTLSEDGTISGTPTEMDTFAVTVRATEQGGGSAVKKLWITVTAPDPEITNPEIVDQHRLPDGAVGVPYSFQLTGKPAFEGDTLKWSIYHLEGYDTGELPPGLSLDENTGLISGTPTTEGEYHFTPFVTEVETGNGFGPTVYLTIHGVSLNPPVIVTGSLPGATVGAAYSVQLAATPVYGGSITWSLVSGSLPNGLTLDGAAGTLTGTPKNAGEAAFTLRATEAGGSAAERAFTLTVAPQPLAPDGQPCVTFSWVGDLLRNEGHYSAVLYLNRERAEGEVLTAALEYTDRGGAAKRVEQPFNYWYYRTLYLNNYLPADAARVDRLVVYLNGTEFAAVPVNADTAPTLRLSFEGNAHQSVWLNVKNAAGRSVYNQYMDGTSEPITLKNLEAGTYTASLTGNVYGFGTLSFGSAAFTLTAGQTTEATMKIGTHRSAVVSPRVTANGGGVWYYTTRWYADEACTELLSTGRTYSLLDDDAVWFVAGPNSSGGVEWTDSVPMRVTSGTAGNVEVPLVQRPMLTASVTTRAEQSDGSGDYEAGEFFLNVARPGLEGYVDSRRLCGYTGQALIAENITEGTVLTVTARSGWYVKDDHASVSHTVTAEEIAAGSLDWAVDIPLVEGRVYLSAKKTTLSGTAPCSLTVSELSSVTLTKADGTQLAISRSGNVVTILEPDKVEVGETLTLYGRSALREYGPELDGSVSFPVGADTEGKKIAHAELELVERRVCRLSLTRTTSGPMSLLIYRSDGSLLGRNDTLFAGRNASSMNFAQNIYGLLPDEYTFVLTDKRYLDTLLPEDFDTASEGVALPYGGHIGADLRTSNGSGTIALTDAEAATDFSRINTELSTVTMTRSMAGCLTLDLNIIPKPEFSPEGDLTIYIKTNQGGDTHGWGGFVGTRSVTVNGIPVDFNRWSYGNKGMIDTDGSITLTLSAAQLALYGGFPLHFSTVFSETDFESAVCVAYLIYNQGGDRMTELVGSFSELTGGIRLDVPEATTDGVFTVWGQGAPCTKFIQGYAADKRMDYNVTILADGVPVAQTKVEGVKGYFKAQIALDAAHMEEYQAVEFVAVGAYDDGSFARVSAPAAVTYAPNDGVLHDYSLSWESHRGDYEAGRMQTIEIWNDGDPVNLTRSWYRGANNSDQARVYWTIHFDNPDRVTAVSVVVPRNGYSTVIEAERQSDGSWQTPLTYIPGTAPDGAVVTYAVKPREERLTVAEEEAYTAEQLQRVYDRLEAMEQIDNLTVAGGNLYFDLNSPGGTPLAVSVVGSELPWDEDEIEDLESFGYAFTEDGDLLPNVALYQEGWFTAGDVDGFEGDGYLCGIMAINRYEEEFGTVYVSTVSTASRRVTVVYDLAERTKTMTVINLGGPELRNPTVNEEVEAWIAASSSLTEEQKELARLKGDVETILDTWDAVYVQLAAAVASAAEAEAKEEPITAHATVQAADPDAAELMGLGLHNPGRFDWDTIQNAAKKLKELERDGKAIKNWNDQADISSKEIEKLHRFLKINNCLDLEFKIQQSGSDRLGAFEVVPEIKEYFGQRMTREVVNALDRATSMGKGFGEQGVKGAWNATVNMLRGYSNTKFNDQVREAAWGRKSEALARRLYLLARFCERYRSHGSGGGTCSGIDWSKWPKDIYDPEKDEQLQGKEERMLEILKARTPDPDRKQTPPPGPQGRYDPSGYVYEAVPSNRVEGATVTLYTLPENAAGYDGSGAVTSLSGAAYAADAEEFGIEPNPQTTGADGRYQWFVPLGWWRVRVSAAGYEDADSGASADYGLEAYRNSTDGLYYMPVLPVQLDVNLPLVSYAAPTVESLEATELGLVLRFSRYMDEASLTAERFTLLVNGAPTAVTVTLADSERSAGGENAPSYTRTLLLVYENAQVGDKVSLVIDNRVLSYSGVAMDERYDSGELTVAASRQVETPTVDVASGEVERNTPVALSCATEGAVIRYTVDGTEPTESSPVYDSLLFVAEDVTVKAAAFRLGMRASEVLTLRYTIPGDKPVPAMVTAAVDGKPAESGTALRSGAALTLTCATEGAEIWYTTNGVCPREDPDPIRYDGPITLEPGTYFFRIRAKLDGVWSDGLPLRFTVGEGALGTLNWTYDNNGITVTGAGLSADSPVYLALYDAAGRMTALKRFTASGQTAHVPQNYAGGKLIWLDTDRAPKCDAVRVG